MFVFVAIWMGRIYNNILHTKAWIKISRCLLGILVLVTNASRTALHDAEDFTRRSFIAYVFSYQLSLDVRIFYFYLHAEYVYTVQVIGAEEFLFCLCLFKEHKTFSIVWVMHYCPQLYYRELIYGVRSQFRNVKGCVISKKRMAIFLRICSYN